VHASKILGVARSTLEQMARIERQKPELVDAIKEGKVSINAACSKARS
jgi:hypothetical protein